MPDLDKVYHPEHVSDNAIQSYLIENVLKLKKVPACQRAGDDTQQMNIKVQYGLFTCSLIQSKKEVSVAFEVDVM